MIPNVHRGIYQQRQDVGSLFVRTNESSIELGANALSSIYTLFSAGITGTTPSIEYQLENDGIRDFDIFFDTIMVFVPTTVMFAKINYNYKTATIGGDLSNVNYIPLSSLDMNTKFGGTWFHEKDKIVTICTVVSCTGGNIFPVLYNLDLETNILDIIYTGITDPMALSSLSISSFEEPVFTYNKYLQLYNISFVINSPSFTNGVFGVAQYNIRATEGEYTLLNATITTPD